jgi:DNA-binding NarL/FixJ family response regulator
VNADTQGVTVLIADQNSVFCAAASRFIAALPGYKAVSRAVAPGEVMAAYAMYKPDIVLMDFAFCSNFSSLDLVYRLKCLMNAPQVILVAPVDDPAYSEHSTRIGADGCVTRDMLESALPALMDKLCVFSTKQIGSLSHKSV